MAGHTGPNPSHAIAGAATITYTSGLVVTTLAIGLAVFLPVLRTRTKTPA